VLVDLPDAAIADNAQWHARREIAAEWASALRERRTELGLGTDLVVYRNVGTNNGDLPTSAWLHGGGPLPASADELDPARLVQFTEIYQRHSILIAVTEFSATAPLKVAARTYPIRAATMPGFSAEMIPALRLDYIEVNRRVGILKDLLDRATGADITFNHPGGDATLHLDLRYRSAHASGGLLPNPGVAGNLPSGEAYIVPYEGEREGERSRSAGTLPVQLGAEVVRYRIEENRAVEVLPGGEAASTEAALLAREPAYGNLAELGLGVLAAFGVKPIGEVLLDEKLGLHIAFGRSDHFGGQVAPRHFSGPQAVVHIDRVYVPEVQPAVGVVSVDLLMEDDTRLPLMRSGDYIPDLFA
jgi:leucyl aminopeptidase (aminopeptidase T)